MSRPLRSRLRSARPSPRAATWVLAASAAVALAAPAAGAEGPSEAGADARDDRIRDLEQRVREQAEAQERLRAEIDALKADRAGSVDRGALRQAVEELVREAGAGGARGAWTGPGRVARPAASVEFGGYFSTRFANSALPGRKQAFQDMRLVPQVHATVSRAVRFDGEVEVEHGGVSGETDGEVKVEFAELRLSESECLAFKAGSLLVPWGRFNQEHDDPLNELSSRPTVARYVGGVVLTAPGVGVEGVLAPADDLSVNYDLAVVNGLEDTISAGDGIRDARTLWEEDENHDKTVFGRLGATPDTGFVDALDLGGSFAWGKLGPKGEDDLRGWALDAAARHGPWEMKAEWMHLGVDRDAPAPGDVRGLHGWYAQVAHRFTDAWVRSLPFADDSASLALVVRRDSVDTDDRVRGAAAVDDERAWTFGVNYRPTTKTVLKFEWRFAESAFPGREGEDRDLVVVEFATYF